MATLLIFPLSPGSAPYPVLQQVMAGQLGEHNRVVVFFPVLGISELTQEKTEERTDNSWRENVSKMWAMEMEFFFFLKKRNGRNDVVFGQEEGQSLGLHVV